MQAIAHDIPRRWTLALLLAALLALGGCTTYVVLPGDVHYEKVSAPYVVTVENATGREFSVAPSGFGRDRGLGAIVVPPGGAFDLLLQVRRFRIGNDDRVGGHQVLNSPYLEQDGANTAVAKLRHAEPHDLLIDLESERWFDAQESDTAQAIPVRIRLADFRPVRWLRNGPR